MQSYAPDLHARDCVPVLVVSRAAAGNPYGTKGHIVTDKVYLNGGIEAGVCMRACLAGREFVTRFCTLLSKLLSVRETRRLCVRFLCSRSVRRWRLFVLLLLFISC